MGEEPPCTVECSTYPSPEQNLQEQRGCQFSECEEFDRRPIHDQDGMGRLTAIMLMRVGPLSVVIRLLPTQINTLEATNALCWRAIPHEMQEQQRGGDGGP